MLKLPISKPLAKFLECRSKVIGYYWSPMGHEGDTAAVSWFDHCNWDSDLDGGGGDFQSISKGSEEMKECCCRKGRDDEKKEVISEIIWKGENKYCKRVGEIMKHFKK